MHLVAAIGPAAQVLLRGFPLPTTCEARREIYLGDALLSLGERESGTARLEEAVEAYRAALKEQTRERVPLQWAIVQSNLGFALLRLGEREIGTARLEEAVVTYRAALQDTATRARSA